jgi:ArsR family transcriptional regulator, virulence genes transcriptional regulator
MKVSSQQMKENCQEVATLLKAIAHPQRLMILCYLAQEELSVSELQSRCGISQSQISQFLIRMTKEGLFHE